MKRIAASILIGALALIAITLFPGCSKQRIVREAYIYGYPLVTMDMTRRQETNVRAPDDAHAPMGQLIKLRTYPRWTTRLPPRPMRTRCTRWSGWMCPRSRGFSAFPTWATAIYIMPMLSGFNEVFFVAGPRATGVKAQKYAVTGPGWSGTLPEGVTQVKSPTALVWILGRIYCTGTPEDYQAVHELQDQFACVPLSSYGKPYTPPPGVVDETFDMKTAVRKQVDAMSAEEFFSYLAKLLKNNPPKPEDAPIVARMAKIGIVPGQELDRSKLPELGEKLDPKLALLEMVETMKAKKPVNGWLYWTSNAGSYGTDYEQRAMVTLIGPGLNYPQDAVYPFSEKDEHGEKYDGASHKYVMHFEKGQMPPVKGFWSLTMYDPEFFFVPNPINRYNLSQRNTFVTNAGRLGGSVSPGGITRPGQGSQLAAGSEGEFRPDAPPLLADGYAADHSRRQLETAGVEARTVNGVYDHGIQILERKDGVRSDGS